MRGRSPGLASRPCDAALSRGLCRGICHGISHPWVEGVGKDVVCLQLAVTHQACDGARRRDLHGAVDVRRPYVQRTAEDAGKAQDVVDLVGEVGASRGHHDGACRAGVLGVDLGRGVGAGKDDRVCGHAPHHLGRQDTRSGIDFAKEALFDILDNEYEFEDLKVL